jgi:hypothetical protein
VAQKGLFKLAFNGNKNYLSINFRISILSKLEYIRKVHISKQTAIRDSQISDYKDPFHIFKKVVKLSFIT